MLRLTDRVHVKNIKGTGENWPLGEEQLVRQEGP